MGDLTVTQARRPSASGWSVPTTCRSGTCAGSAITCRRRACDIENLSESWLGFSLSGPRAREILARSPARDVCRPRPAVHGLRAASTSASTPAVVARVSLTGELGYEINVPRLAAARALAGAAGRRHADSACGRSACARRTACGSKRATASGRWSSRSPTRRDGGARSLRRLRQGRVHRPRCRSWPSASAGPAQRLVLLAGRQRRRRRHAASSRSIAQDRRVGFVTSGRLRPPRAPEPGAGLRRHRMVRNIRPAVGHDSRQTARGPDPARRRPTIQRARNCVADVPRIRGGDA